MGKTRVGVLIRETVGGSKSANRSADLVTLTQKYNGWTKKIRALIISLEKYHATIGQLRETRAAVSNDVSFIASFFLWLLTSCVVLCT